LLDFAWLYNCQYPFLAIKVGNYLVRVPDRPCNKDLYRLLDHSHLGAILELMMFYSFNLHKIHWIISCFLNFNSCFLCHINDCDLIVYWIKFKEYICVFIIKTLSTHHQIKYSIYLENKLTFIVIPKHYHNYLIKLRLYFRLITIDLNFGKIFFTHQKL